MFRSKWFQLTPVDALNVNVCLMLNSHIFAIMRHQNKLFL